MHQHSNRDRLEPESALMDDPPRWYDYPPEGLWLAVLLQVDSVPHTDSVGRSEHGIGTQAAIGAIEPARSLGDWSVATHMFASTVMGLFSTLARGLA